jgi:two-component system chemotaxis response regulator CheY
MVKATARRRPTVLIVDDDAPTRTTLGHALTGAGYIVTEAGDGAAAWDVLRRAPVTAVLTDLTLLRRGGLRLLRDIRADARLGPLPVVVLVGERLRAREAMDAGASRVVLKPFTDAEIVAALAEAIAEAIGDAPR